MESIDFRKKTIINDVRNKITGSDELKNKVPEVYDMISFKVIEEYGENYEHKFYHQIENEEIWKCVKEDLKEVEKIMGMHLYDYTTSDIEDFLLQYFLKRENLKLASILFRGSNEGKFNPKKSVNAHIKRGKFRYDYEAFVQTFNDREITSEEKFDLKLAWEILEAGRILLGRLAFQGCLKSVSYKNLFFQWCNIMEDIYEMCIAQIKSEYSSLQYVMMCIEIVSDSILRWLNDLVIVVSEEEVERYVERIFGYCKWSNEIIKQKNVNFKNDCYNLIEDFGVHIRCYVLKEERRIKGAIYQFLAEEELPKLNKKYSVVGKDISEMGKELKIYFEENDETRVLKKTFQSRVEDCKTVLKYYSEKHQLSMNPEDPIYLKAAYRELFVMTDVPKGIDRRKAKSFVNQIENDEFKELKNMTEKETFYRLKIQRGVERELENDDLRKKKARINQSYFNFEDSIMKEEYMRGNYLVDWLEVIRKLPSSLL